MIHKENILKRLDKICIQAKKKIDEFPDFSFRNLPRVCLCGRRFVPDGKNVFCPHCRKVNRPRRHYNVYSNL